MPDSGHRLCRAVWLPVRPRRRSSLAWYSSSSPASLAFEDMWSRFFCPTLHIVGCCSNRRGPDPATGKTDHFLPRRYRCGALDAVLLANTMAFEDVAFDASISIPVPQAFEGVHKGMLP